MDESRPQTLAEIEAFNFQGSVRPAHLAGTPLVPHLLPATHDGQPMIRSYLGFVEEVTDAYVQVHVVTGDEAERLLRAQVPWDLWDLWSVGCHVAHEDLLHSFIELGVYEPDHYVLCLYDKAQPKQ